MLLLLVKVSTWVYDSYPSEQLSSVLSLDPALCPCKEPKNSTLSYLSMCVNKERVLIQSSSVYELFHFEIETNLIFN